MTPERAVRGRVLVADDDDAVRRFTSFVLRSGGFEVEVFGTGFEAIQALARSSYDACVADIKMPGNERLELVQALKSGAVSLVLITGEPSVDTVVAALRGGVVDYLVKPFKPAELMDRVTAAVDRAQAARAQHQRQASIAALVEAAAQVVGAVGRSAPAAEPASWRSVGAVQGPAVDSDVASASAEPQLPADVVKCLSPRQLEIVRLLAKGHPLPEVAELLDLSVHTVRGHMKAIFSKLGVTSQVALLGRLSGRAQDKGRAR